METLVWMKMVPDVVEDLEIAADGTSLDTDLCRNLKRYRSCCLTSIADAAG